MTVMVVIWKVRKRLLLFCAPKLKKNYWPEIGVIWWEYVPELILETLHFGDIW